MKLICLLLVLALALPVQALDLQPPSVPSSGADVMPQSPESFGQGLWELFRSALYYLSPTMQSGAGICVQVLSAVLLMGIASAFVQDIGQQILQILSSVVIGIVLFSSGTAMISLATETIRELADYGKLLSGVLAAGLAAQGGVNTSAALYTISAIFHTVLTSVVTGILVPGVYVYLACGIICQLFPRELLERLVSSLKGLLHWSLKIVLYAFTGFMTVSGVLSGSADAIAIKATKLTISSMVPLVGGILSDASESVLLSAGILKNGAGIYGMLAILSVCLLPFLKIGCQYLLLKLVAGVGQTVAGKQSVGIVEVFTGAMGFLMAMLGTVSLVLLIQTVCFLKGMN